MPLQQAFSKLIITTYSLFPPLFLISLSLILTGCSSSSNDESSTSTNNSSNISLKSGVVFKVFENSAINSKIDKVEINNPQQQSLKYQLLHTSKVGIQNDGTLFVKSSIDYETTTEFNASLQILNSGGTSAFSKTLIFKVLDLPDQNSNTGSNPLLPYQWYIKNHGLQIFNSSPTLANIDLNINKAYTTYGLNGSNVIVSIMDTGLEITHEDLVDNIITGSDDFSDGFGNDVNPVNTSTPHGTNVAGIIAMRDNNYKGGAGIASRASLVGFNYLVGANQTIPNFSRSVGADSNIAMDIVNMSFGYSNALSFIGKSDEEDVLWERLLKGRNGLGTIFVKAFGNEFLSATNSHQCEYANTQQASCGNSFEDQINTLPIITVGSVNSQGKKSSYSTIGSNLWISGLGGEGGYAVNRHAYNQNSLYYFNDSAYQAAILTTDASGCQAGRSRSNYGAYKPSVNDFDYVWQTFNILVFPNKVVFNYPQSTNVGVSAHQLNPQCNYTASFTGTSAAAPTVSGVVALILQANPQLTFRDVRHILAKTARKIDPSYQHKFTKRDGNTVILSNGWITNDAGFNFSNWYGFGLIDTDAAVIMAKSYSANSWAKLSSATKSVAGAVNFNQSKIQFSNPIKNLSITNNSAQPVNSSLSFDSNLFIEHIEINLDIEGGDSLRDIKIALESPANTKAIIFQPASGITLNHLTPDKRLSTNAFYGERASGTWRLSISDEFSNAENRIGETTFGNGQSKLSGWQMKIYGH